MIVRLLEPPFPAVGKDRTRSLLSHVIVNLELEKTEHRTGLYVHNAGEHLHLPTMPPASHRDFGPTEFTASAHYILAASLSSLFPGCETALNYVDETLGVSHAFARAALDLRAGRLTKAIVAGALLAFPLDSDLTTHDEIVFAIMLDSYEKAEQLSAQFSGASDRMTVRHQVMKLAGRAT
jgi:hypothetical protein